ncbi:MAG: peptide deformylase [Candidatus Geothermincolia bacterium]
MAIMPIREFGDPVLKEQTREVREINDSIRKVIENMIDTLYDAPGVGLASTQVGVTDRIFVYDVGEGAQVCINPVITFVDDEMTDDEDDLEGCLSLPGVDLPVKRHERVVLDYTNLEGERHRMEAEGLLARVIQHEIDHLDGKVILDRAERADRAEALKRLRGQSPY